MRAWGFPLALSLSLTRTLALLLPLSHTLALLLPLSLTLAPLQVSGRLVAFFIISTPLHPQLCLENATVRGRAWYMLLDAPVLTRFEVTVRTFLTFSSWPSG